MTSDLTMKLSEEEGNSVTGRHQAGLESIRVAAARRLTDLLERHERFSYLRLGDGELQCILAVGEGKDPPRYRFRDDGAASIEAPFSVSGIETRRIPALLDAYKHCTFLDYCDNIPAVRNALRTVDLGRTTGQLRNLSPETSNLLAELCTDPRYREIAGGVLPFERLPVFHQLREDGRRFSENLELIREDLREEIRRNRVDTLMLSLASGAKILCHELATEMSIGSGPVAAGALRPEAVSLQQ
jgi:hypothetical protein